MFFIDYKSRKPLYEQLVSSIKDEILKGKLEPDTKLPSVRELAADLTIHPNTIQKAYRSLELEGYIYSVRGRGNYVVKLEANIIDSQIKDTFEGIEQLMKKAMDLGVKDEDLFIKVKAIQKKLRRDEDDNNQ